MKPPHSRRPRALVILALWIITTGALILAVGLWRPLTARGELDGLVPAERRDVHTRSTTWLVVEVTDALGSLDGDDDPHAPSHRLLRAADRLHRALDGRWVPIAAPVQEVSVWLDRHLLFLVTPTEHARLAERLTPEAMKAAAQGIRARLTSPLFTASGEEPRRDPLGLRPLLASSIGRAADDGAQATAAGDLLSGDGRRLLIEVRGDDDPTTLTDRARAAIADPGVRVAAIGEALREANARAQVREGLRGPPITAAALVLMILALGTRGVRTALILTGAAIVAAIVASLWIGEVDLASVTLLPILLALAGEGVIDRRRISGVGRAAPLLLAAALAPLLLAPYPTWQAWALPWALAVILFFAIVHGVAPAALADAEPAGSPPRGPALRLRPRPWIAASIAALVVAVAVVVAPAATLVGPAAPPLRDPAAADEAAMRRDFFDPRAVVTVDRSGDDLADALVRSIDAAAILERPGAPARLVDAPGSLIVDDDELERRAEALAGLAVPARMRALEGAIADAGMRPSAFAEFLHGAAELDDRPSAARALAGPLRAWIDAHTRADGEAVVLRSRAFFADVDAIPPELADDGATGAALVDASERARLPRRLGIVAAVGLWIGALITWLTGRSLAVAVAAALTGGLAELGVIALLVALGLPLGPAMLPALLLIGALGVITGARAGRSIDGDEPLAIGPTILGALAWIAGGVALLAAPEPLWQAIGAVIAGGSALALGLGLVVAPGLTHLLARLLREAGGPR
ncbi:MAG: hypothetical protein R3B09_25115 [Nannocystaceae bacterium]